MNYLVAFDGSAGSVAASEFLKKILKKDDNVIGLFIFTKTDFPAEYEMFEGEITFDTLENLIYYLRDLFKAIFENYNERFTYIIPERLTIGSAIVKYANEENVDVIVTGTRKLKGIEKLIMGSVSQTIISESSKPVLVVPP
ncbi:MAG: universal stress protein [Thermoplasmata archaeon]|jgi:nucleotide-binding universal stress UspA family protein